MVPVDPNFPDFDNDHLSDVVEFIYGTNPAQSDTDGDGITDGVEADQGTNPLDNRPTVTGIIASVDTGGTAMDVCALNNVAVVADGLGGVVVFDATDPFNPVQAAVVPTIALATAVARAGNFVAVAQGDAGLTVLDITTPSNPRNRYDLFLGGEARAVAASGNTAFVGLGNSAVVVVDMPSGAVLERLAMPNRVDDLSVRGAHLFVVTATQLRSYRWQEGLSLESQMALDGVADPITGRRRLFTGTAVAFVSNQRGFQAFDIQEPAAMVELQNFPSGLASLKQVLDNGSGLGVVAARINPGPGSAGGIFLYDISAPTNPPAFLTMLPTAGESRAASIFNGLAYVADGNAGLQVVNYLAYDAQRIPPTITLEMSFPLTSPTNGHVESGQFITLTAHVTDDVQVRHVEFYVDGRLAVTDGNFPFEQSFVPPLLTTNQTNFTVRAKATDTGGNATFSPEIVVQLLTDTTGPRVTSRFPAPNALPGAVDMMLVQFNERLNPATINASGVMVIGAGADGHLGTSDDVLVIDATLSWRDADNTVVMTFGTSLAAGLYRVSVGSPLADLAGNVAQNAAWTFRVLGVADADQDGIPDTAEASLGFDPLNPDSDGDGIPDGAEDLDADGLATNWELTFGYDPARRDSDNDLINDDQEDPDAEGLTNIGEFLLGSDPTNPDTDGDGWNDETEVTGNSNALSPSETPNRGFVAQPPIRVIALGVGTTDGLPLNTFVAQPPVKVIAPGTGSTDGLPLNTFVAQPPVQVHIE
jgi:hypothetical protein